MIDCQSQGVTCRVGAAEEWSWSVADPRYPETRTLASLELRGLVVATGRGEAFVVAVHADAGVAGQTAARLLGGPEPTAVGPGTWALVQTQDGALHELGDPGVLIARTVTP